MTRYQASRWISRYRPSLWREVIFSERSPAAGIARLLVAGADDRGVLYGTFALLRRIALHGEIETLDEQDAPYAPVRWTNEWDNLDGSIERGYAGG